MIKPKVKKLAPGTYRVAFTKTQSYDVIIPNLWVEIGDEKQCREIAIEVASEQLEFIG